MIKEKLVLIFCLALVMGNHFCFAEESVRRVAERRLEPQQETTPGVRGDTIEMKAETAGVGISQDNLELKQEAAPGIRSDAIEIKTKVATGGIAQDKIELRQEIASGIRSDVIAKPAEEIMGPSQKIITTPTISSGKAIVSSENVVRSGSVKPVHKENNIQVKKLTNP